MDPIIGGALISGGASLLGGLLGRKSSQSAADRNVKLQREFAQRGVQWKVADARKAGVHPLYALGAQTSQFTPVAMEDPLPNAIQNMGQDISRATLAVADRRRQAAEFEAGARMRELQVENMFQQNNLLAQQQLQVAAETERTYLENQRFKLAQQMVNQPGTPSVGTSVEMKPSEQIRARAGAASREDFKGLGKPGFIPTRIGGDRFGYTLDVPNNALSEAMESMGLLSAVIGPGIWGSHILGLGADRAMPSVKEAYRRFLRYGTPK